MGLCPMSGLLLSEAKLSMLTLANDAFFVLLKDLCSLLSMRILYLRPCRGCRSDCCPALWGTSSCVGRTKRRLLVDVWSNGTRFGGYILQIVQPRANRTACSARGCWIETIGISRSSFAFDSIGKVSCGVDAACRGCTARGRIHPTQHTNPVTADVRGPQLIMPVLLASLRSPLNSVNSS